MSLGLLKRITSKPSRWTHLHRPQIKRINTDFSNYKIFKMPENSTAAMKKQMNGAWKSAFELSKLDETNEEFDNFDPALKSTIKLEMAYSLRMMKNYSESVKYYEQYLFMDDPTQPKFDLFNIKTLWSLYLRTNKSKYAEGLFETYLNSLPLYHVEDGVKSTNMARIDLKHHYGIFLRDEMKVHMKMLLFMLRFQCVMWSLIPEKLWNGWIKRLIKLNYFKQTQLTFYLLIRSKSMVRLRRCSYALIIAQSIRNGGFKIISNGREHKERIMKLNRKRKIN